MDRLPDHVVLHIFRLVDQLCDAGSLARTCRRMAMLARDPLLLEHLQVERWLAEHLSVGGGGGGGDGRRRLPEPHKFPPWNVVEPILFKAADRGCTAAVHWLMSRLPLLGRRRPSDDESTNEESESASDQNDDDVNDDENTTGKARLVLRPTDTPVSTTPMLRAAFQGRAGVVDVFMRIFRQLCDDDDDDDDGVGGKLDKLEPLQWHPEDEDSGVPFSPPTRFRPCPKPPLFASRRAMRRYWTVVFSVRIDRWFCVGLYGAWLSDTADAHHWRTVWDKCMPYRVTGRFQLVRDGPRLCILGHVIDQGNAAAALRRLCGAGMDEDTRSICRTMYEVDWVLTQVHVSPTLQELVPVMRCVIKRDEAALSVLIDTLGTFVVSPLTPIRAEGTSDVRTNVLHRAAETGHAGIMRLLLDAIRRDGGDDVLGNMLRAKEAEHRELPVVRALRCNSFVFPTEMVSMMLDAHAEDRRNGLRDAVSLLLQDPEWCKKKRGDDHDHHDDDVDGDDAEGGDDGEEEEVDVWKELCRTHQLTAVPTDVLLHQMSRRQYVRLVSTAQARNKARRSVELPCSYTSYSALAAAASWPLCKDSLMDMETISKIQDTPLADEAVAVCHRLLDEFGARASPYAVAGALRTRSLELAHRMLEQRLQSRGAQGVSWTVTDRVVDLYRIASVLTDRPTGAPPPAEQVTLSSVPEMVDMRDADAAERVLRASMTREARLDMMKHAMTRSHKWKLSVGADEAPEDPLNWTACGRQGERPPLAAYRSALDMLVSSDTEMESVHQMVHLTVTMTPFGMALRAQPGPQRAAIARMADLRRVVAVTARLLVQAHGLLDPPSEEASVDEMVDYVRSHPGIAVVVSMNVAHIVLQTISQAWKRGANLPHGQLCVAMGLARSVRMIVRHLYDGWAQLAPRAGSAAMHEPAMFMCAMDWDGNPQTAPGTESEEGGGLDGEDEDDDRWTDTTRGEEEMVLGGRFGAMERRLAWFAAEDDATADARWYDLMVASGAVFLRSEIVHAVHQQRVRDWVLEADLEAAMQDCCPSRSRPMGSGVCVAPPVGGPQIGGRRQRRSLGVAVELT